MINGDFDIDSTNYNGNITSQAISFVSVIAKET